jgi:hypothetical protein
LPIVLLWAAALPVSAAVHVWERQELTFTASRDFANPYTDVTVWVDLTGPHFQKRVYGFWDGGQTFRVRLARTPDRNLFLLYFEKRRPRGQVRGARLNGTYAVQWFDLRTGAWQDAGELRSSATGIINLPDFAADDDWGLRLTFEASPVRP